MSLACMSILPIVFVFAATANNKIQYKKTRKNDTANGNCHIEWWIIAVDWFRKKWIIQICCTFFNCSHVRDGTFVWNCKWKKKIMSPIRKNAWYHKSLCIFILFLYYQFLSASFFISKTIAKKLPNNFHSKKVKQPNKVNAKRMCVGVCVPHSNSSNRKTNWCIIYGTI